MKRTSEYSLITTCKFRETHQCHLQQSYNSMFAVLRRSFQYIDRETFIPVYKTLVQTHLDYASPVYSPFKIKHYWVIRSSPKKSNTTDSVDEEQTYSERLRELDLPTLSYRRIRGDMIEVFKIINGKYDKSTSQFIKLWKDMALRSGPRGNSNKIFTRRRAKYDIRKDSFTPGIYTKDCSNVEHRVHSNRLFQNSLTSPWQY